MRKRPWPVVAVCCVVVMLCGGGGAARGAAAGSAGSAGGAGGAADKSRYTLFEPTPPGLMREFSTDRPDITESAYTLDAGHFQVELSFVEYAYDDEDGERFDEFVVMPSNLKLGLLNNVDLQLVFEPYVHQRLRADGDEETADGFGATQVRLKVNLWGNDGGPAVGIQTALAIMPFVQFPTAEDDIGGVDDVEGGVIIPLSVGLPDDWSLGLMAEVDFVRDEADEGYGVSFLHTAALGHPITERLGGFVEYAGFANHNLGIGYAALAGGGLTYGVNDNVQLDCGIYFGLSDDADDFSARVGLSFRI